MRHVAFLAKGHLHVEGFRRADRRDGEEQEREEHRWCRHRWQVWLVQAGLVTPDRVWLLRGRLGYSW